MRIWIRNNAYFLADLRICRLGQQGNFRICDLRINHYRFAGLQFCGLLHLRNLRIWRLQNEPKNLRINKKQICVPTFGLVYIISNT